MIDPPAARVDKTGEAGYGATMRLPGVGHAWTLPAMIAPWHAATALLATLSIVLVCAFPYLAQGEEPAAAKPAPLQCQRSAFRVVVDVGHTPEVPGAISARGIPEYAFNLQLARAIKQTLVDSGFDRTVLLMTATAPPTGLVKRAVAANNLRADLFLSIHHDSVPDNLLDTWQYEGQPQHFNDQFPGYAIFISNDNPDRAGSLSFGKLLGKHLQAQGLQYTPHYTLPVMGHRRRELVDADAGVYRYDQLTVLRMTRMPAVLLEAGSIVNRQEELELASAERQSAASAAIAGAVEDFCTARAAARKGERFARRPPSGAPGHPDLTDPAPLAR